MSDVITIWKCTGRLYNEHDASWMWIDYYQTKERAKEACEIKAREGKEGVLTWGPEETDGYQRAITEKRNGWIYELQPIEVLP